MAPKKTTKNSKSTPAKTVAKAAAEPVIKEEATVKVEATPAVDTAPEKTVEDQKPAEKAPAKTKTSSRATSTKAPAKKASTARAKKVEPSVALKETTPAEKITENAAIPAPAAKSPAKKNTINAAAKATSKKSSNAAKPGAIQETYFEIAGEQILMEEINEKIRQAWLAEGHYPSRLRTIRTYLNLSERRAYYVINGKAENKYVEF